MSRIALLDIFQATFAVAGVAALVADRDWFRHRLADHLRDALDIEAPKQKPIDVEVTVKVTARLTPTSRRAAHDVEHGSFLADSVVGLDMIDFDADSFEVDLSRGVSVAVDDLKGDGTLADLETEWLSDTVDVPVLQ